MSMALANMNSELLRRQQIERYRGSPFDMAPTTPRNPDHSKFKFQKECVFLAACLSEDMDEVKKLLDDGIDIDAANVDGLTALHQACIYNRMEMVKFLVDHSADVNVCDNDGWTPLHAACSNGFVNIARFLSNNGSKVDAVSFDGELPIDVAEGEEMHELISEIMEKTGIGAEYARKQEEERMLEDAKYWLTSGTYSNSLTHPKTGASPLHVAAARGYVSVLRVLLQAGANINAQDLDGWTPLHAAAHWAHRDACQLLVENLCDLTIKDSFGLLAQDVADPELGNFVEELKKKQLTLYSEIRNSKRASFAGRRRGSVSRLSFDQKQMMLQKSRDEERARIEMMLARRSGRINSADKMNTLVFGVEEEKEEEEITGDNVQKTDDEASGQCKSVQIGNMPPEKSAGHIAIGSQKGEKNMNDEGVQSSGKEEGLDKNEGDVFKEDGIERKDEDAAEEYAKKEDGKAIEEGENEELHAKQDEDNTEEGVYEEVYAKEDENTNNMEEHDEEPKVVEGRASSQQRIDKDTFSELEIVKQQNKINNCKTADANKEFNEEHRSLTSQLSESHPPEICRYSSEQMSDSLASSDLFPVLKHTYQTAAPSGGRYLSSATTAALADLARSHRWSSEESKRDEDKEVPRKARSIQARKSRRSTQGITKEDVDRAEASLQAANRHIKDELQETKTSSKVLTEDNDIDLVEASSCTQEEFEEPKPVSDVTNTKEDITLMLYRRGAGEEESGLLPSIIFEENEAKLAALERAQRKRERRQLSRPVKLEHMEEAERNGQHSCHISGSSGACLSSQPEIICQATSEGKNKATDYKRLFEKERSVNELLSQEIKCLQQELKDAKLDLEHAKKINRNKARLASEAGFSLQEKRALERKIAELEEELKNSEALKTDNQRLKEENAALIRVISRLSK